ncbi:14935_t:CDS:2, partial [Racocetra persica]
MLDQIKTVDKSRLIKKLGKLTEKEIGRTLDCQSNYAGSIPVTRSKLADMAEWLTR